MEDEAYEMRETESWEGWCGERKKMRKERVQRIGEKKIDEGERKKNHLHIKQ